MNRLQLIENLLRTHDIEGLLDIGAPEDEYNTEAKMIAERIGTAEWRIHPQKLPVAQVKEIIRNVWAETFALDEEDLAKRERAFEEIAKRLFVEPRSGDI